MTEATSIDTPLSRGLSPALLEHVRVLTGGRPAGSEEPVPDDATAAALDLQLVTRDWAAHGRWRLTVRGKVALSTLRDVTGTVIRGRRHDPQPELAAAVGAGDAGHSVCAACFSAAAPAVFWPCDQAVLYWPDLNLDPGDWAMEPYLVRMMGRDDDALYDRLAAQIGQDEAARVWRGACRIADAASDAEAAASAAREASATAMRALRAAEVAVRQLRDAAHPELDGDAGANILGLLAAAHASAAGADALICRALPQE